MSCYRKAKLVFDAFRGFQRHYRSSILATKQPGAWKRFYSTEQYLVQKFRHVSPKRWFKYPQTAIIGVLICSGLTISVYFGNFETVPYTKRKRFMLLSKETDREIGEFLFSNLMADYEGKILPDTHPVSIRVTRIARNIILGLDRQPVWKYLFESRKNGHERGRQQTTDHLEAFDWEVLVVNDPSIDVICVPDGKIFIFTGYLEHLRSDGEIATVVAREVAHVVARHYAEVMTKKMWLFILKLILQFLWRPHLISATSHFLLRLPYSRRMEMEADYIGLLLMASAGYDPRVAPKLLENLAQIFDDTALSDYFSTHPSFKKRAELLRQDKVMQEAYKLYCELMADEVITGVFLTLLFLLFTIPFMMNKPHLD